MPPNNAAVPASQPKAFRKSSREEERPADSQKKQTNIAALFGKPLPSFTGLSDEKVLQAVKWAPIESGGHTAGSKVSVFRNKYIADFVRENPSLVFDKATEKEVRARSLTAYEARDAGVLVETGDDLSGFLYVGPEKEDDIQETDKEMEKRRPNQGAVEVVLSDAEQMIDVAQVEGEEEAQPGMWAIENAKSAQSKIVAKKPKKHFREAELEVEDESIRKVAKMLENPSLVVAGTLTTGVQKPKDAPAEKAQAEKRPLADDGDLGSESSDVDLVQEAVNPNGKSFTVLQLQVKGCHDFRLIYSNYSPRHGCANTALPLQETSRC